MTMFWKEIMGLWQLRACLATSSQEDGRWFLTYSDDDDDPCNGSDDDTSIVMIMVMMMMVMMMVMTMIPSQEYPVHEKPQRNSAQWWQFIGVL